MFSIKNTKFWALLIPLFILGFFLFIVIYCPKTARHSLFFPPLSQIGNTFFQMFLSGELAETTLITLKRFFLGFILGNILGLSIGFFCGISRMARVLMEPLIYSIYPIPRFALLPFLILFFGTGLNSQIFFISMGTFFPLVINTISGIENINSTFLEVAKHNGARGWKLYWRVILPGSLPSIFSGLRISIGLTFTYTIIFEYLAVASGIGAMMWQSLQTLRTDKLLLGTLLIVSINVCLTGILKIAERISMPWCRD